ncbi:hypothetical protein TTRE_0000624601 [Trichuris trichiura]|uniref:Uncharacterized protein n=1 Tax=Trichuris trichiura TaxID=36087 RepID=A0A077ZC24_TRITR|nr:hypothetical protein TTRE_0000624601 [Trichuris trichiura]
MHLRLRFELRSLLTYVQLQNGKPESGLTTEAKLQTRPLDRPADYKVEREQETYRLRMIDPKTEPVRTEVTSQTLPADLRRVRKPHDFPSSHSHCSFIKLNPLERPQRQRLRSLEVRPITPHDYLSESLERHRAISLSPLRSKLKVDEKSVNEPWQRIPRPERKEGPPSWRTLEKEDSFSIAEGVPPYRFRERSVLSPTCFSECDPRDNQIYDSYTPAILLLPASVGGALNSRQRDRPWAYGERTRKRLPHEVLTSLVDRQRDFYSEQKNRISEQQERDNWLRRSGRYFSRTGPMSTSYGSSQSVNNPVESSWYSKNEGYRIGTAAPWRYKAPEKPYEQSYSPKAQPSYGSGPRYVTREKWPRPSSAPLFKEKITLPMRQLPVAQEDYSFAYDDFNERVSISERSGRNTPKAYYDERPLGVRRTSESSCFESTKQSDRRPPSSRQDVACQYDPVGQVTVALQSTEATDTQDDRTGQGSSTLRDQQTGLQAHTLNSKLSTLREEEEEEAKRGAYLKQSVSNESFVRSAPAHSQRVDDNRVTSSRVRELMETTKSKTWHRTYPVETPTDVVKSRIVCGKEVLATDAFLIDMEARRKKFMESPPMPPEINRTGKTWRMPEVEPYQYPERRTPLRTFESVDDKHYFWKPELVEPLFKRETKRFTPPPSPQQQFAPDIRGQKSQSDFARTRRLFEQLMVETRKMEDAAQRLNDLSPERGVADTPKDRVRSSGPALPPQSPPSAIRASGFDLLKSPRVPDDVSQYIADYSPQRRSPPVKEMSSAQYVHRENFYRSHNEYPPPQRSARHQDMAEIAEIRKKLMENARNRSTVNINEVSKVEAELLPIPSPPKCQAQTNVASWEFNSAFSPRSVVSINGHTDNRGLLRIRTDLSPAASKFQTVPKSNVSVQTYDQTASVAPQVVPLQAVLLPIGAASSLTREWTRDYRTVQEVDGKFSSGDAEETGSRQSTLIKIKDEHAKKPKSIMKQQKLATQEARSENVRRVAREEVPQVTETIEKIEETTTTEEVERRIRGRSKKDKRERHHGRKGEHRHLDYARGRAGALNWPQRSGTFDDPPWTTPFGASHDSPWRHRPMVQSNYEQHQTSQPTVRETYHREVKSKKVHDSGSNGSYYRTPEYRRRDDYWRDDYGRGGQFHKSYSSRNIFHNDFADDFDTQYPIVEFPPTLPRDGDASQQRHHVQKSRSLLDWEDQRRADMMRSRRAWDDGMEDLERDFRDSLLMPMPPYGGNLRQREYREQEIPGGHETFSREVTAQSGSRPHPSSGRGGGGVTHFKESKQEMQYKKEHTTDRL